MKWSLDLTIAVVLTVLIWTGFYFAFPSEPFSALETVFVLAVIYGLVKLAHLAWNRWGPAAKAGGK